MIAFLRPISLCLIAAAALLTACAPKQEPAAVGGPFTLTDQNGRAVNESILKGKWSAVFFGFTYCPDVCPTTLQALGEAQEKLGAKAKKFQVIFVSVDPERDTPQTLKSYLDSSAFPKGTIGLSGSPEQVAAAAKAYRVYYKKVGEGDGYQVQHTSAVFLMDPKGRFDRAIGGGMTPEEMAGQIKDAMG